jgi:hypothetical protein
VRMARGGSKIVKSPAGRPAARPGPPGSVGSPAAGAGSSAGPRSGSPRCSLVAGRGGSGARVGPPPGQYVEPGNAHIETAETPHQPPAPIRRRRGRTRIHIAPWGSTASPSPRSSRSTTSRTGASS